MRSKVIHHHHNEMKRQENISFESEKFNILNQLVFVQLQKPDETAECCVTKSFSNLFNNESF
jgi:hypothetical protein